MFADCPAALAARPRVACIIGTRPEAIKMAPVMLALRDQALFEPSLIATGQHPDLVADALAPFDLVADHELRVERTNGSLAELASRSLEAIDGYLEAIGPDIVVVQGDTATTFCAALAAFWRRLKVVHLEAGLRTRDMHHPFPEEANRRLTAPIADLHLPPTAASAANLVAEGIDPASIVVCGNTVIDALLHTVERAAPFTDPRVQAAHDADGKLLLVTAHRRESWGAGISRVSSAIATLAKERPWLTVVLPLHPNPSVRQTVRDQLGGIDNVVLTEPLPYAQFARVMARADLAITDSGGVQEEAPSLGVPVLVTRERTERPEGVDAGVAELVGTDEQLIVRRASELLDNPEAWAAMAHAVSPYGDGQAARRSAEAMAWLMDMGERPEPFDPTTCSTATKARA